MSRAGAGRNRAKKPPLSLVDKGIYIALLVLGFSFILFFTLYFGHRLPIKIAFSDEAVVACRNTVAMLCAIPFTMLTSMTLIVLVSIGMRKKQPIIGNKKYTPPRFEPTIKVQPLLSRTFWYELSGKARRRSKRIALLLGIAFLVCLVLLPLGFYPRQVLDRNDNFTSYNSWNVVTDSRKMQDAERLVIRITHSGRRRDDWGIQMTFLFADAEYIVNLGSFYGMSMEQKLNYMLYLKEQIGENRYEIEEVDRVDRFISKQRLTAKEAALVYELFDCSE